jgi:Concanavalin A-like lectin/glucanases superfamily
MKRAMRWILLGFAVSGAVACGSGAMPGDVLPEEAVTEDTGEVEQAASPATMPAPLGYWRFDDCVSGKTTLNDYSSNNYAATISSGLTCSSSGKVMRAGSFNGTSGKAEVPDKSAINSAIASSFTISAWVKPTTLPTSSTHSYAIATKWNNSKDAFKLLLTSGGYKFTVTLPPASGTTTERQFSAIAPTSFSSTNWTHVAGTYNKSTGNVILYVNGGVAATKAVTSPTSMQTSTAPFRIGNSPTSGSTTYGFAGLIDEVRLGKGALSQTQIQALMSGPHVDSSGTCFEAPKTSKVLVLVYDAYHPSAHHDQATHGNSIIDAVASSHQLVDFFREATNGLLNYQIADVRFFNGEPPQGGTPVPGSTADYGAILTQNNLCTHVTNDNISEVWIWGDGNSGLDELAYKVPGDKIPNKSLEENGWLYDWRTKDIPDCGKTVVVMGWNYFVGLDNIVHAYNHRIECMLSMTVGKGRFLLNIPDPANPNPAIDPYLDPTNPWSTFSRWDGNATVPHQAAVGTVHFPPNGRQDYDYGNTTAVASTAADWLKYPFLTGAKTQVSCTAWGCDNQLAYQKWYDSHIPRAKGVSYGGMCNSWWTYIADYDRRNGSCSGTSCLQAVGGLCDHDSECSSNTCRCGKCAAAGTNPVCKSAAFDTCSTASDCESGICGCTGETGTKLCLPNESYVTTCYQPDGGPCWGDADCASGVCGCNGGDKVQCLPAGSSRACSNIGNWSACLHDNECQSGVCGCNGGPRPMVCLPTSQYPKTCIN